MLKRLLDKFFPKCENCGERHDRWGQIDCDIFHSMVRDVQREVAMQIEVDNDKSLEPKRLLEK